MYHMISDQLAKGKKSGLRVSSEMFEKQLKYFKDNGWKFIKMSELKNHEKENKVVAITFDDGYLDNYSQALPLLKKYDACATLYLVIDRHQNDWSVKKNPKHNTGVLADEEKLSDERTSYTDNLRDEFGTRLIVLPNPNYGDWESNGIFGGKSLNDYQKDSVRGTKINSY